MRQELLKHTAAACMAAIDYGYRNRNMEPALPPVEPVAERKKAKRTWYVLIDGSVTKEKPKRTPTDASPWIGTVRASTRAEALAQVNR